MSYEAAFTALSDPTRRAIVETLRAAPSPVGQLARQFPVSRPAISQHLKVLAEAGLVTADRHGTARVYRLAPEGWSDLRGYLDRLWNDALAAYAREAHRKAKEQRT